MVRVWSLRDWCGLRHIAGGTLQRSVAAERAVLRGDGCGCVAPAKSSTCWRGPNSGNEERSRMRSVRPWPRVSSHGAVRTSRTRSRLHSSERPALGQRRHRSR